LDVIAEYDLFFSSRRRHTRCLSDWSSDVCSSDLKAGTPATKSTPATKPAVAAAATKATPTTKPAVVAPATKSTSATKPAVTTTEIGRASGRERVEISEGGREYNEREQT